MNKICTKCNILKEFKKFSKNKNFKDGYCYTCKECHKEYRKINKDKLKNQAKEYYQNNKVILSQKQKEYNIKNKEKLCKYFKNRYDSIKNSEEYKQYQEQYYLNNKDEINKRNRKYNKLYNKLNRGKLNAKWAKYKASQLQATPKWLNKDQLKEIEWFYITAKELQWLSEEPLEVDHIIPLQGENISGLHVPWNLQILPLKQNRSKSNKII